MKKRMILAIAALLVFGLSIAAFAYKQATTANNTAMTSSCCKGDSCPMKHKDASTGETASCCDNCDCCKGGDSCPMKMKGEKSAAVSGDMQNVTVAASGESCDCSCCDHKKNS